MDTATIGNTASTKAATDGIIGVYQELKNFRSKIPRKVLDKYERPTTVKALRQILQDWAMIIIGHQVFVRRPSVWTLATCMILMAWAQRGLSTLLHDAIHYNLFGDKALDDVVAGLVLAPPMMSTMSVSRKDHAAHHHYLGTEADPDHGVHNETSLKHYRNNRFDHTSILSLFLYDVVDPTLFIQNAVGAFSRTPILLALWWSGATILFSFIEPATSLYGFPLPKGWRFFVIFHATRCTLSYAVYVLREIIDHSGLPSESVLAFTRTSPCCNAIQKFIQPHDDNYHLLHHLLPKVPMGHLHELHLWLIDHVEEYANANRFTKYFGGNDGLLTQAIHLHVKESDEPPE